MHTSATRLRLHGDVSRSVASVEAEGSALHIKERRGAVHLCSLERTNEPSQRHSEAAEEPFKLSTHY